MNILILSSGTRNKVVQYFKAALKGNGRVICTDMSNLAPSIYEADQFYTVPRMTAPGYIDAILASGILALFAAVAAARKILSTCS